MTRAWMIKVWFQAKEKHFVVVKCVTALALPVSNRSLIGTKAVGALRFPLISASGICNDRALPPFVLQLGAYANRLFASHWYLFLRLSVKSCLPLNSWFLLTSFIMFLLVVCCVYRLLPSTEHHNSFIPSGLRGAFKLSGSSSPMSQERNPFHVSEPHPYVSPTLPWPWARCFVLNYRWRSVLLGCLQIAVRGKT